MASNARGGGMRGRTAIGALWRVFRQSRKPGAPGFGDLLSAFPRMLKARLSGQYKGVSLGKLAVMAAAVGYIASPIDVLPEALLLVFGLADDAIVFTWLAGAALDESGRYLEWEKNAQQVASERVPAQAPIIDGAVVGSRRGDR